MKTRRIFSAPNDTSRGAPLKGACGSQWRISTCSDTLMSGAGDRNRVPRENCLCARRNVGATSQRDSYGLPKLRSGNSCPPSTSSGQAQTRGKLFESQQERPLVPGDILANNFPNGAYTFPVQPCTAARNSASRIEAVVNFNLIICNLTRCNLTGAAGSPAEQGRQTPKLSSFILLGTGRAGLGIFARWETKRECD
jgi:hypothetical protein